MYKSASLVATVSLCSGLFAVLFPFASALRCYQCESETNWSDCHSKAREVNCDTTTRLVIMGQDIFRPQERQLKRACVSVFAEGTAEGFPGKAYLRDCFYDDVSMCATIQASMPSGVTVKECDLCTTDLCNGANRFSIDVSSLLLLVALVVWCSK